jgi:hypothetical protein
MSLLVFAPTAWILATLYRQTATRRSATIILCAAALAAAFSSILFVEATDWGRWISIHAVCLMLLLMLVLRQAPVTASEPATSRLRPLPALLLAAYAILWALPPLLPALRNYRGYYGLYAYYRDIHTPHAQPPATSSPLPHLHS